MKPVLGLSVRRMHSVEDFSKSFLVNSLPLGLGSSEFIFVHIHTSKAVTLHSFGAMRCTITRNGNVRLEENYLAIAFEEQIKQVLQGRGIYGSEVLFCLELQPSEK